MFKAGEMKKELASLGIAFALLIISLKIAFYKEALLVVIRTAFAIFWLFVIPGFSIMYYWKELNFFTRLIISVPVSAAVIGTASYYLGLLGLNVNYHAVILPIVMIAVGVWINFRRAKLQLI